MVDFQVQFNSFLPLRDVVFNTLRDAILRGELKPGARLMEIQIANKMGVSRTPVREAIRKLEAEGLVLMIPRKGAEVSEITEKSLRDVLDVRQALEALAVRLSCLRITAEEIQLLKNRSVEFDNIINTKDLTKLAQVDVAFHDVIYESTHNPRLISLLSEIREQMYRYRIEYLKVPSNRLTVHDEHVSLIKAMEDRDVERAIHISTTHIENQVNQVAEALKND